MRFYTDAIGLGLLLPFVTGAGLALCCVGLARLRIKPLGHALAGMAPGVAVLLATFLLGWLQFPPRFSNDWLSYIGLIAGIGYLLQVALAGQGWLAWLVALEVGAAVAWVQVPRQPQVLAMAGPFWLLFVPQIILLHWLALPRAANEADSIAGLVPVVTWAGGAALLVALTGNARFGQIAGMVAATLAGAGVCGLCREGQSTWRHLVPGTSVVLAGVVLQGYLFSRSDWEAVSPHDAPTLSFVLLLAAPLATLIGEVPGIDRLGPWGRALVRTLAVGLVVAFALHTALNWPEPMPESAGDEDW